MDQVENNSLAASADMIKRLYPEEYHRRFLEKGIRSDGRKLKDIRNHLVTPGVIASADSSCLAKIGRTTMIAGIKLAVGIPHPSTPKQGEISCEVYFTPLCSNKFSIGRTSEEAQTLGCFLQRMITGCQMIDLQDLCIVEGRSAWKIFLDVYCIDDDGNTTDAAVSASVLALKELYLPHVEVADDGTVSRIKDSKGKKIVLRHVPVSLSFGLVENKVICDPSSDEEILSQASLNILCNEKGQYLQVYKPGGMALSAETMKSCMDLASSYAKSFQYRLE